MRRRAFIALSVRQNLCSRRGSSTQHRVFRGRNVRREMVARSSGEVVLSGLGKVHARKNLGGVTS